jgi:hypothetical protein
MSWSIIGTAGIALLSGYLGSALPGVLSPQIGRAQTARITPSPGVDNAVAKTLSAEHIIVTDEKGNTRAELKVEKGAGEIVFYGPDGQVRWKGPLGPHIVH